MLIKYPKNRYLKLSALLLLTLNLCFVNLYATNKTDDSKNHTPNFLNSKPTNTRLWYEINYFEDFSKQIDEDATDKKNAVNKRVKQAVRLINQSNVSALPSGYPNDEDLDDDNDWILDSNECLTKQVFAYTGSDQSFTVPAGVTSIDVNIWGAGGGGSKIGRAHV
jgi:hypothetical protein